MTIDEALKEVAGRADAGQKLGLVAIEMVVLLARQLNQRIDLESFAKGFEDHSMLGDLAPADRALEIAARERVVTLLRLMAQRM